jgi:cyanate permease
MSFGGWVSGVIFDATGSYAAAFANGLAWNALNIVIVVALLLRARASFVTKGGLATRVSTN